MKKFKYTHHKFISINVIMTTKFCFFLNSYQFLHLLMVRIMHRQISTESQFCNNAEAQQEERFFCKKEVCTFTSLSFVFDFSFLYIFQLVTGYDWLNLLT